MALQGTLDTFALPDVLRLLDSTRKTGCLHLNGARGTGNLWVADGAVVGSEASNVRAGVDAVDVIFELLRFEDGSFTFDQNAEPADPQTGRPVNVLLSDAEARMEEWREIEKVVPSLECWVRLVPEVAEDVTLTAERWRTVTAVGAGTTVRRIGDDLDLPEVGVSKRVKDLVEAGLAEVDDAPQSAPAAVEETFTGTVAENDSFEPLVFDATPAPDDDGPSSLEEVLNVGSGFDLDTPGDDGDRGADVDDSPLPSLASLTGAADEVVPAEPASILGGSDDPEIAQQLANLSPKAAAAVQAAAEAMTDEEREAALDSAGDDDTINRGLLLKFLSSVRS